MDSSDLLSSRRDRIKANNYNNQKETEYPNKMPRLSSQDLIDIKRGVQEVSLDNRTIVLPACGGPTCAQDVGGIYPPSKQGWFVETIDMTNTDERYTYFNPTSIDFDTAGNVYYAGYRAPPSIGQDGLFIFCVNSTGVTLVYSYVYQNTNDAMCSIAIDRTGTGIDYIYTFDAIGLSGNRLTKLSIDLTSPYNPVVAVVTTYVNSSIYSLNNTGSIAIKPSTTGAGVVLFFGVGNVYAETTSISGSGIGAGSMNFTIAAGDDPSTTPAGYVNTTTLPTDARFEPINTTTPPPPDPGFITNYSYIIFKNSSITDFYVTDAGNNVLRFLEDQMGYKVNTFVGPDPPQQSAGFVDGSSLNTATTFVRFGAPAGLTYYGTSGNIMVTDVRNNAFRSIDQSLNVSTIASLNLGGLAVLNAEFKVDGPLSSPLTNYSRPLALKVLPSNPNIIYFADQFRGTYTRQYTPNIRRLIYYP